jgi:hypothetical protein
MVLGIQPSSAYEVGDPIRRTGRTFDSSRWFLDSASDIEEGVELADSLTRLLDRVEEARSGLWQLEGEGYWVNWLCFVGSHALEHNVDLDRELLRRLLACPGELWLDVYEAGPEDGLGLVAPAKIDPLHDTGLS